ncbi:MAG: GerMN domain-containing protein [Actinomycetota bacterium]|nr:GerMN domain-containing protein [Actinomycetota bacterium]
MKKLVYFAILSATLAALLITGCSRESKVAREVSQRLQNQEDLVQINICYPANGMLIEETREIEKSKFGPAEAVRQIFEAPNVVKEYKPAIPITKVLDVKIESDTAIVNFERSVLNFKASEFDQQLVIAAITNTLAQFPNIKKLKLQVEGRESGKIGGKDIEKFWGGVTLKSQPWKVQ